MNDTAEASGFSRAEIDDGHRLFGGEWTFASAAGSVASLPARAVPEIAFAGRSNVGKSSLINALTRRRALARTSNTPGRTQELIFFTGASGPARAGGYARLRLRGGGKEQGQRLDAAYSRLPARSRHARARLSVRRRAPRSHGGRRRYPRHARSGRSELSDRAHQGRSRRAGRRSQSRSRIVAGRAGAPARRLSGRSRDARRSTGAGIAELRAAIGRLLQRALISGFRMSKICPARAAALNVQQRACEARSL